MSENRNSEERFSKTLKARVAALTEDAAKQKALPDVAEERALEFAGSATPLELKLKT